MTRIHVHRPRRPSPVSATARPNEWGNWSDLFGEFLGAQRGAGPGPDVRVPQSRGVYPLVNLHETKDAYVLTAELPGIASEEIDVALEGKTVTLSGQRKIDYEAGDGTAVLRRERQSGHFKRAFELPSTFQIDEAQATHKAGVLELRLPKTPESKPRQIAVQTS